MTLRDIIKCNGNQECYFCLLQENINEFLKDQKENHGEELNKTQKEFFEHCVDSAMDNMMDNIRNNVLHDLFYNAKNYK